jgi:hypothetical protein
MSALLTENVLSETDDDFLRCRTDMLKAIMNKNNERIIEVFNRLLAGIPYDDHIKKIAKNSISDNDYGFSVQEWNYRSNILCFLRGCGIVVIAEMHTNLGRPDLVVTHKGTTYVIEIKVASKSADVPKKLDEAKNQIIDNQYAKPYPDSVCLAVVINDEKRQIVEYEQVN